jgi:hypothetical protein
MDEPKDYKEQPLNLTEFHNKVEARYKLAEKPQLKEKDVFVLRKGKNKKK